MRNYLNKLIPLTVFLLAGCSSLFNKPLVPVVDRPIQIDSYVLEPCKELEMLNAKTPEDILNNLANNAIIYSECKDKHEIAVKILRSISNK